MGALTRSYRAKPWAKSSEPVDLYLLHFSRPLAHAQHYLGVAKNGIERRVEEHQRGAGAKITRAAVAAGIELTLVKTWLQVPRDKERRLKQRTLRPHCSICKNGGLT